MSNQPYQPYQQPYSPSPVQYYAPPQTSGMATTSLVFGILSWFLLPLIGSIIAVICGHAAKSEIRNSNGRLTGEGMATTGLVLGYIQLILGGLGLCAGLVYFVLMVLGISLMGTGYY